MQQYSPMENVSQKMPYTTKQEGPTKVTVSEVLEGAALVKPAVQELIKKYDSASMAEYVNELYTERKLAPSEVFLASLRKEVEKLFPEKADKVVEEINRYGTMNTAPHTAPAFFTDAAHAILVGAAHSKLQDRETALIATASLISKSNPDLPGGVYYDGVGTSFISTKNKSTPVALLEAFTKDFYLKSIDEFSGRYGVEKLRQLAEENGVTDGFDDKVRIGAANACIHSENENYQISKPLQDWLKKHSLVKEFEAIKAQAELARTEIKSFFESLPPSTFPEENGAKSLVDQTCLINHAIFEKIREHNSAFLSVVPVSLEHLATRILREDLQDSGSFLSSLLFDSQRRTDLLQSFAGIEQAWSFPSNAAYEEALASQGKTKGTHLFWGISPQGRLFPLRVVEGKEKDLGEGTFLYGEPAKEEPCALPLTPEALNKHTEWLLSDTPHSHRGTLLIAPSVGLINIIHQSHGVHCLGGYSQAEYATQINERLLPFTEGFPHEQQRVQSCETDKMTYGMHLGFEEKQGTMIPFTPWSAMKEEVQVDLEGLPVPLSLASGSRSIFRDYPERDFLAKGMSKEELLRLQKMELEDIITTSDTLPSLPRGDLDDLSF